GANRHAFTVANQHGAVFDRRTTDRIHGSTRDRHCLRRERRSSRHAGGEGQKRQDCERAHQRDPPRFSGTKPSSKSVRQACCGSIRSKSIAPSIHTFSARVYTLNGSPDQSTTSAFFPTSMDPIRSSRPSAHAGLIVI